ncbi:MAG: restriction endonuclease subunit S [Planctomycetes bacterium]|nr:restriction endonuclease subunit S [Planctomycetota bacterium]
MNTTKWERKPLGAVAGLCLGKMLDQKKNKGELLPYLANVNVRWGEFSLDGLRTMRFEPREMDRYGLKFGDIVMCEGGEPGRCAIWKNQVPGMMIQKALHRIRPREVLDYRFAHYNLLHIGQSKGFDQFFTGSTIKHLPLEKLARVEINVPPLPVQRRIASILSAYDDLMENSQRRIRLLEAMARALYREWFVHFRFPGHEKLPLVATPLGDIPKGWQVMELAKVCVDHQGIQTGPFGSQLHESDYSDEGVPVVMPKDLIDFRISTENIARIPEETAENLSRHRMRPGDIVYGRRGDIGRRAFLMAYQAGWFCGTGCLRIRPNPQPVNGWYLFNYLGQSDVVGLIQGRAQGVTMPNLNTGVMSSVPVRLPPRKLQDHFAHLTFPMAEAREALTATIENLRRTRDLLLQRLLSGQVELAPSNGKETNP